MFPSLQSPTLILILCLTFSCGPSSSADRGEPLTGEATTDTSPPVTNPTLTEGSHPTSCGAPNQDLTPIDCTENGDEDAQCVYSNHCYCNVDAGFECAVVSAAGSLRECDPGISCLPAQDTTPDINEGSHPTSCGSPTQDLTPIDCTLNGDVNAQCVFSNHCYCTAADGFKCESVSEWDSTEECDPGIPCIPAS